ncbi:MAG: hypothetical protein AVDCRST_MAG49-922 [uncultured Thermomicrobiales bacterium]|uniref:SH3b domain-containing protein n=1 Tax=uncultured Thermomicrobiales bacterium TaxID=1645740 RepID=A0A6J4U5Q0_9BACT|nr:MAG: hypothetical protein AVDCRST_MAG49-922 [uncultured Thermomicrobiales bacterium]
MQRTGLSRRLDQHGRRSGLAVGLSMALATALLVGVFVTIWGQVDPLLSDFVAAEIEPTATQVRAQVAAVTPADGAPDDGTGANAGAGPTATPVPPTATVPPPPTQTPPPTATREAFVATRESNPNESVNLRAEPSQAAGVDVLTVLPPATPLRPLGPRETDSAGGVWIRVETEDGDEGWVLEIATVEIAPQPPT